MDELKKLLYDIENLRKRLNNLIANNENLQDPEIISASQILNAAVTKYTEVISKKNKK